MSHRATNWAIQQRGLKPATKLVLWYLCDRHNPDYGCFPSQQQLAEDAEMSVSSLNEHLAKLEAMGLIRRERRINPRTRKQENTRYILGCEAEFAQVPPPESGDGETGTGPEHPVSPSPKSGGGTVSGFSGEPSPENGDFRLQNPETNPVREPVREEEESASAHFAILENLLAVLGIDADEAGPWWSGQVAVAAVERWLALGLSGAQIVETGRAFAEVVPDAPQGPKALDRAMRRAADAPSRNASPPQQPRRSRRADLTSGEMLAAREANLALIAEKIRAGRHIPGNAVSSAMRGELLARAMVTEADLRAAGVL